MDTQLLQSQFLDSGVLLDPLRVEATAISPGWGTYRGADLRVEAILPSDGQRFVFAAALQPRSTPKAIHQAIMEIRFCCQQERDEPLLPLIVSPYLSAERLNELEEAGVSGVDLCGNGVITIPGRLLIYRTGNSNSYPDSRTVSAPFRGKSSLVGRVFLSHAANPDGAAKFDSLGDVRDAILEKGGMISMSQVSKAVSALEEERILNTRGRSIFLVEPDQLLTELASAWRPSIKRKLNLRVTDWEQQAERLSAVPDLDWAVTGESSVSKYAAFSQGKPIRIAVSSLSLARENLDAKDESIPNFADIELLETSESGFYFDTKHVVTRNLFDQPIDEIGTHWASALQTWIELVNGDPRQQEVAGEIRDNLIIAPDYSLT